MYHRVCSPVCLKVGLTVGDRMHSSEGMTLLMMVGIMVGPTTYLNP